MSKVQQSLEQKFDLFNPYPEIEIWKDIQGFEGKYQVSSFGRIKSLGRYYLTGKFQQSRKYVPDTFLILSIGNTGCCRTHFSIGLRKRKMFSVHRLVAEAFIPNPLNKPQVNHINGLKTDNRVENLEWVTGSENMIHAFEKELQKPIKGEYRTDSKLKDCDILDIRYKSANRLCKQKDLAEKYKISKQVICQIIKRQIWKHI